MNATPRIPQATLQEEWAVAVTQLWARALGVAVAQAHAAGDVTAYQRSAA